MNQDDNKFRKVEWSGDQYSPADDDLDGLPAPPARSLSDDDLALLKLAALAIGCVLFEEVEGEEYANLHFIDGEVLNAWNPLVHNDDAFDLMVRLELDVTFMNGDVLVLNMCKGGGEPTARARLALTGAAAEVGKTIPSSQALSEYPVGSNHCVSMKITR